jgi:ABC-2 type transport system ATP-binding protein
MIEVTNLTKKYGDHVAVDNLSFTVEKGQIYGFLGPNGAGKSTTMNIITGYLAATEGTVLINGKDIQKEPEEAKKCVGYLPEMPPVYMDMTVGEYLKFAAELKKVPKAERNTQVSEVMEMTQTSDKKDRLIKNLSKGYRQRVGLAQALLGFPEVIILDEPTVGLDPKQIIEIRDLIKKLGENHTIILSSHILSEVSAVCDHIMIISKGKLVASDSPEGLQKLMSGAPELEVIIKGDADKVHTVLENVAGVASVTDVNADEAADKMTVNEQSTDCRQYKIVADGDKDLRESIFYTCADNKLPIMGMTYNRKSLEDIFLELTDSVEPEEEKPKHKLFAKKHAAEEDTADKEDAVNEEAAVNKEEEE